jgi:hypothetical protein
MTWRMRPPWRVLKDKAGAAGRLPPDAQAPWPGQKRPTAPSGRDRRQDASVRTAEGETTVRGRWAIAKDVVASTIGSSAATAPDIPQIE